MSIFRTLLLTLAVALGTHCFPAAASDDFPKKPVTVMVGYTAGGPTDVLMRAIAQRLTEEWKQQVIVDNRPGANESIAAQAAARAPADGYTLLFSTEGPLTQNQFLYSKLAFNPEKDFVPISLIGTSPLTLVVPTAFPANSLGEFIAYAKSRAGTKPLLYGSAGVGGITHLPTAMLSKQHGLNMVHVPYKGTAPLLPDLISGNVDAAFISLASMAPFVREGKLKALVVDAPKRLKVMPQVPVFSETTVAPVQADFIYALVAPTGTPPAITERISAAVKAIVNDPKFREIHLDPYGYVTVGSSPKELGQYLAKDRPLQAERIKVSGAKLD